MLGRAGVRLRLVVPALVRPVVGAVLTGLVCSALVALTTRLAETAVTAVVGLGLYGLVVVPFDELRSVLGGSVRALVPRPATERD